MIAPRVTDEFRPAYSAADAGDVLATRLAPPPQPARILPRPRVDALLAAAAEYPLTLVVAPAGSGKTIALAALAARGGWPAAWLRLLPREHPASLLRHLAAAFRAWPAVDQARVAEAIGRLDETATRWTAGHQAALDALVTQLAAALDDDTLLVLDDFQHADARPALRAAFDHLLAVLPPRLHLVIAARHPPALAALSTALARGEALQIPAAELALTADEARALLALHELPHPPDAAELALASRGWPLAVQLAAATAPAAGADPLAAAGPLLDEYLAREVLEDLPPPLRELLLRTALLRRLEPGAVAALAEPPGEQGQAAALERWALFVEERGWARCYQPLFGAFLGRAARRLQGAPALHQRLAEHYRAAGDLEAALHHLLEAGAPERAAELLEGGLAQPLPAERAPAVLAWVERLPDDLRRRPRLLEARGDAERALGRFEPALRLYRQAEEAYERRGDAEGRLRALRRRAEIYLDTVQPAPAVALLKQVLKLLPRERRAERAAILRLQAENWGNSGRADVAMILERAAHRTEDDHVAGRPGEVGAPPASNSDATPPPRHPAAPAEAPARLLLRSGRLHEARRQLEAELGLEPQGTEHPLQLLHREPILLLSLIYALLGSGARALAMARRGLLEAQRGESPLTEAVARMRHGHALQIMPQRDESAADEYLQALDLIRAVGVARTRAEAHLGLTLHHGRAGRIAEAESAAAEGLLVAEAAGDEWTAALIWLALGGAASAADDQRAPAWLDEARQRFARGGDTYGLAAVALWLARWHIARGADDEAARQIETLLGLAQRHGYDGLLTAPTLFGPRDMAVLLPILLRGRAGAGPRAAYAQVLLRQAFPSIGADDSVESYHPGFTLRVQMLGTFRVWRGDDEIHPRDWQREKARQLLQLLLTYRGTWLQREQICAWLWPDSDAVAAERQFKVTLNALNAALEPQRPPRTAPFFIRRQGLAYSFAPSYGCWIDVDEFELRTAGSPPSDPELALRSAHAAVQLYHGDFLAEALYDPWTTEERERLLARFLAAATALAAREADAGRLQQAAELCEQILRRDHGYEEAYQVLMRAHARAGSRSQALRAYARCVQCLADDLGIEPLPETTDLHEKIKRNDPV